MRRALVLLFLLLVLAGLACRTVPAPARHKVVMVSLDGGDALTLHRLHREGRLSAGGFARFFLDGQVAEGLAPVDPTITAPNHITLATGYRADETGIVDNYIRLPGTPINRIANGFAAEIHTETLWEAARRQGLRVGISGWPGADAKGVRRQGDWGLAYTSRPAVPAELVTLPLAEWTHPVREGEWGRVPCRSGGGSEACWAKVLDVDRERGLVRVYFNAVYRLPAAYPAGFEALLHDAGLSWPGPPDVARLDETWEGRPGIDLDTWSEQVERFGAFFTDVLLALARYSEWDLLMSYSSVLDDAGHQLYLADPRQPGYSAERRDELERARVRIWQSVDRDLVRLLDAMDLRTTTVLVVSDHGMEPVHTQIDLDALFRDWGLLRVGPGGEVLADSRANMVGGGGLCHVHVQGGLSAEELRARLLAWEPGRGAIQRILTRAEAAEIGLDHPSSGDLVLLAASGYMFRDEEDDVSPAAVEPAPLYGKHGYSSADPSMRGLYLAVGAGVRQGRAGVVPGTDVAGRVADWLGIEKPRRRPPATPAP